MLADLLAPLGDALPAGSTGTSEKAAIGEDRAPGAPSAPLAPDSQPPKAITSLDALLEPVAVAAAGDGAAGHLEGAPVLRGVLAGALSPCLLSIPGDRLGAARISDNAEGVAAPALLHASGVDAPSVDAGGAAQAPWDDPTDDAARGRADGAIDGAPTGSLASDAGAEPHGATSTMTIAGFMFYAPVSLGGSNITWASATGNCTATISWEKDSVAADNAASDGAAMPPQGNTLLTFRLTSYAPAGGFTKADLKAKYRAGGDLVGFSASPGSFVDLDAFMSGNCTFTLLSRQLNYSQLMNHRTHTTFRPVYASTRHRITFHGLDGQAVTDARGGNGFYGSPSQAVSTNMDFITAPSSGFQKGMRIASWKTFDGSLTLACYTIATFRYATDLDLYPDIEYKSYQIAYDLGGGTLDGPVESYDTKDGAALGAPARPGYAFLGWDVSVAEGGCLVPEVDERGRVVGVRPGTYGDLSCAARWAPVYDLSLPVASPSDVRFDVDATTLQVRAVGQSASEDGSSHGLVLSSSMAVPVALSRVECEALRAEGGGLALDQVLGGSAEGGPPAASLASEGQGASSKVSFSLTAGDAQAEVSPGSSTEAVGGFVIPPVSDDGSGGELAVALSMKLDESVEVGDVAGSLEAVPAARISYTADVAGAIAAEHDLFILDGGPSGTVYGLEDIRRDSAVLAAGQGDPAYGATRARWERYLDEPDANPAYLRLSDGTLQRVQVLGIAQDVKASDGEPVGLTFGFRDLYACAGRDGQEVLVEAPMAPGDGPCLGWEGSALRDHLQGYVLGLMGEVGEAVVPVAKSQLALPYEGAPAADLAGSTADSLFVPSFSEVFGFSPLGGVPEGGSQYQWFAKGGAAVPNPYAAKGHAGQPRAWWLRSAFVGESPGFSAVWQDGSPGCLPAAEPAAVLPCFCL